MNELMNAMSKSDPSQGYIFLKGSRHEQAIVRAIKIIR